MKILMKIMILLMFFGECTHATFLIKRGVNLNIWLEGDAVDSVKLSTQMPHSKIDSLKKWGFDHVRIPVSEQCLFNENMEFRDDVVNVLLDVIDYSISIQIKVIFDLHKTRNHSFGNTTSSLFFEKKEQEKFFLIWGRIQSILSLFPDTMLAYECLNEPAAPQKSHELWNDLLSKWVEFVRKQEPSRVLFVGPNRGYALWTLKYLKLPKDDQNLVLTLHYYKPKNLTHYEAEWTSCRYYHGPVAYPGQTIPLENYAELPDSLKIKYKSAVEFFDINTMRENFIYALKYAKENNIQLNVGEFGCRRTVPDKERYAWMKDVVSVFNENNISYTVWGAHGAGFGMYAGKGILDTTMVKILLQKGDDRSQ